MKSLRFLWLGISMFMLSFVVNANGTFHNDKEQIVTYRTVEQNTADGIKFIPMSSNGDVFNANEIVGMSGSGRLNEINARYARNTSAIRQRGDAVRLESNKITSENVVAECMNFLQKNSAKLGIDPTNLRHFNTLVSDKMFTVVFFQTINGYDIRNSFVRLYVFPNGRIQTFSSMYYDDIYDAIPNINLSDVSLLSADKILDAATLGLKDDNPNKHYNLSYGDPVILPIFNGSGYTYRAVIEADLEIPGFELYKVSIDLANLELLQRRNLAFNANVRVESRHYTDPNQPLVTEPLRNLRFTIEGVSGEVISNASGMINNLPDEVAGKKWTTRMVGNHADVKKVMYPAQNTGAQDFVFEGTITPNYEILMTDSNNYAELVRTIFNNVRLARTYYAQLDGSDPLVGSSIICYAQMLENSSLDTALSVPFNARAYGSGALGFLAVDHRRVFMGRLDKVAFHEYGHSMVHSKYSSIKGTGMFSGLANEANADITSAFITGNPRVFDGITTPELATWALGSGLYRTCDNTFVYPDNINGAIHRDSQVLSGAFWRFKNLVGGDEEDFFNVKSAVHFAKEYVPDGYTTEAVMASWFDALVRAADRFNPENDYGVPIYDEFEYLFDEIYHAFNTHRIGFNMLINDRFRHTNVADQSNASNATSVSCNILEFAAPKVIEEVFVNYYTHLDSERKSAALTRQETSTGNTYNGEIPALEEGSRVFYYFTYRDPFSGNIERINSNFFYFSGYETLHYNDCETANNWIPSHSSAAATEYGFSLSGPAIFYDDDVGPWNHVLYNPGYAADGNRCWATTTKRVSDPTPSNPNNTVIRSMLDTSTITSPVFNFTEHNQVFLTYQMYYVCRIGDNTSPSGLFVEVSFDGGDTWKTTQEFRGRQKPINWDWNREYVNLTKFLEAGENFSNMRVRFRCYSNNRSLGLNVLIDEIALLGTNHPDNVEYNFINELAVSPNPVSNEATLTFPHAVVNPEISVLNTLGNEVLNTTLQGEFNFTKFNTSALPIGVYFLKVYSNGKVYQTKLVIAR